MRYAIVDIANLFNRARHVTSGDIYSRAGMSLTIMFRSLNRLYKDFNADHIVFACEGKSWRNAVYPEYKAARRVAKMAKSLKEKEEDDFFFEILDDFIAFVSEKTRCTVLQCDGVEGDDFIARWCQLHPDDEHIILSGDSDFVQLISEKVSIYDGVGERHIKHNGVFDTNGNELVFTVDGSSGKVKVSGTIADVKKKHDKAEKEKKKKNPEYEIKPFSFTIEPNWWEKALFFKCIRGDSGDGIFSACPGARTKGSKNKIGINEAWEDRGGKGFKWNNFMLQRWQKLVGHDADGNPITKEVKVLNEYEINRKLIDLSMQPDDIKVKMDQVIIDAVQKEPVAMVGLNFMQFCGKHDLPAISKESTYHAAYLNKGYK